MRIPINTHFLLIVTILTSIKIIKQQKAPNQYQLSARYLSLTLSVVATSICLVFMKTQSLLTSAFTPIPLLPLV